jgi:O-antigen/teichoic acid export membrane protein
MSAQRQPAGFFQVLRAVGWSFLGIRRRAQHEADAPQLSPKQVIITGIAAAAVFVLVLIAVVHLVISRVTAGS